MRITILMAFLIASSACYGEMTCISPYQQHYGYVYSNRDNTDVYFFLNRGNIAGNLDRRYGAFSYRFSGTGSEFFDLENRYPNIAGRRIGFFVESCSVVRENSANEFGPRVMEIDRIRIISEYDMTDMIAQYFDDLGLPEAVERRERHRSDRN